MAHDVFISYSHVDVDTAVALCDSLESNGFRCWYAPRDIAPGDEWASAIMSALESCRIMVLVFSKDSNKSVQVLREVNNAVTLKKFIIPYKIDDSTPTGGMNYYLATLQWLDETLSGREDSLKELNGRIAHVMDPDNDEEESTGQVYLPPVSLGEKKKSVFRRILSKGKDLLFALGALIIAGFFLYVDLGMSSYKNSTFIAMMTIVVLSLVSLFFRIMSMFGKKLTKRPGWLKLGVWALVAIVAFLWGAAVEGNAPASWTPDALGEDAEMNQANYSMLAVGSDNTVYFADCSDNGTPLIRYCTLEGFIAGEEGTVLVEGINADNLVLPDNEHLVFRDASGNKRMMKMVDVSTGRIKILNKSTTYAYWTSRTNVLYGEDSLSSTGVGILTLDGKYSGSVVEDIMYGGIYYYRGDLYYVKQNGSVINESTGSSEGFSPQGIYIIYDDHFYYSTEEGIYRKPLGWQEDEEALSDMVARGMVAHGDRLYFLSGSGGGGKLYRVPVSGGEAELVNDEYFTAVNIIGDCLYLCRGDGKYMRINTEGI